jgi:hypothetical protein
MMQPVLQRGKSPIEVTKNQNIRIMLQQWQV